MDGAVGRGEMVLRGVVGVLVAWVVGPLLLFDLYMLLYSLPAVVGAGERICEPGLLGWGTCWRPEPRLWWIVSAGIVLPGVICVVMAVRGFRRPGLWWPWLMGSMGLLVAGAFATSHIL
ncbi:hypothetical protein KOI35_33000 [Actinoplanes bogorensis]|uniref:Uncharacterized protein n=1 Tax=Paractinoplanes bogorensis TaxID=1610840 RepID=A0ABS5YY21_9ACTN|nr:hypothetical protein [Actinoplanes bogorensis]MBU2668342.1 hypothetical protein [Actinoplanes bogorensis]